MFYNWKYLLVYLFVLSFLINAQSYSLVWSDEFFSSSLNTNNWTMETGGGGWGNNELQYYTDRLDNAYIEDGKLVIEAKEESFGGRNYTSARLKTEGKKFFKYGKIEARIKLPHGQGIWPAFWMLGENIGSVSWPACGEIDIMEKIGGTNNENVVYGTLHWEENGHASYGGHYNLNGSVFSEDYHIFGIEWTPQTIKWYVDGTMYHSTDITPAGLSEFHEDFFILLNVAVGGDWPGPPDGTTVFPQKMYVDYVRVYADQSAIPQVALAIPASGTTFDPYTDINIKADVTFEGDLTQVDFYQDAVKIGSTGLEPFEMNWRNVSPGCYKISAKAISANGYVGQSQVIEVQVGETCSEFPYTGSPTLIPGKIEAENFNGGDPGTAFNDTEVQNQGGAYRISDQVDLQLCSDVGGGYNIGWTVVGEWMKYFVEVDESGDYIISSRIASSAGTGAFRVEFDGVDKTGTINVPNTGGWQTWSSVNSDPVTLQKGVYSMRVFVEGGDFNFNRMDIYPQDAEPSITIISPNGGEILGKNSIQEVVWKSVLVDDVAIGLSTDNGTSWNFITQKTTCDFGVYRWIAPDVNANECLVMIIDKSNSSLRDTSDTTFIIDDVSNVSPVNSHPKDFILEQNYPNPFNPTTNISFRIPDSGKRKFTTLTIYDVLGKVVAIPLSGNLQAGEHRVSFDASGLPSGIYFGVLVSENYKSTIKMSLLK